MARDQYLKILERRKQIAYQRALNQGLLPASVRRRERQAKEAERRREQEVKKLIDKINEGKVSSVSEIPAEYRRFINISQEQLNSIREQARIQQEAQLWKQAYDLANKVVNSKNPAAIFAIGFSDNPYAKQAYREVKENRSAYKQRTKVIRDIRDGKIKDVSIRGNRVITTSTGRPFTVTLAAKKQYADEINSQLPRGDKLILDKKFNILGINSKNLGQTIQWNQRNLDSYSNRLQRIETRSKLASYSPGNIKNQSKTEEALQFFEKNLASDKKRLSEVEKQLAKAIKNKNRQEALKISREKDKLQNNIRGLAVGKRITETIDGLKYIGTALKLLVEDPRNIAPITGAVVGGIKADLIDTKNLIRTSPNEAIGKLGADYLIFKGSGKALKAIGKLKGNVVARISPKFVGTAKTGKVLKVNVRGKNIELRVAGRIGSKTLPRETLKTKVSRVGTIPTAVSTQADRLVGVIQRNKLIRKPIKGDKKFSRRTEALLKKFDNSKINKRELLELDTRLKSEGTKGILERSFFADPEGRIRPSRSGLDGEATLKDLITGKVTFKEPKPQILVFDDIKVEQLPKSLGLIKRKLKNNKPLNSAETAKLLEFQLQRSGKFKPLGFMSGEPEITLAPGEIIKRQKKIGVTIINGKSVPIIKVTVIKASPSTRKLLIKAKRGKINPKELKRLKKQLKIESGFKPRLSSSKVGAKYFPTKRISASSLIGSIKRNYASVYSNKKRKSSITRFSRRKISGSKKGSRKTPLNRRSINSRKASSKRGSTKKRSGKSLFSKSKTGSNKNSFNKVNLRKTSFKPKKLSKAVQTYYVVEKVRGKFKKLYPKPLTAKDAKDYAVYSIDNNLSKTAFFIPLGKAKNVVKPPKKIEGYYSANSRKVRPYRIKFGKKKQLVNGFIEKRKYFRDTAGENKQIKRLRKLTPKQRKAMMKNLAKARLKKRGSRPRRKTVKRRLSPTQRKILLKRLKKARAVRMKKLRKKRR